MYQLAISSVFSVLSEVFERRCRADYASGVPSFHLCATRLRLGKPPQTSDDTAVIPPSLDWHGYANPSFFKKIITLFQ